MTQSDVAYGGAPERVIDGNTSGTWRDRSVSHTSRQQLPWLQLDLGADALLSTVVLWNRTDAHLGQRLSNFRLTLTNTAGQPVATQDFYRATGYAQQTEVWTLPEPVEGRYLLIEKLGLGRLNTNFLSLAEVELYGPEGAQAVSTDTPQHIHEFTQAGTTHVLALLPTGEYGKLAVQVHQADYGTTRQDILNNNRGKFGFSTARFDLGLLHEGGESVQLTPHTPNVHFAFSTERGHRNVIVRLYEDGPIITRKLLNFVGFADSVQGDTVTSFLSPSFSGYKQVSTPIVLDGLPEGGRVEVTIYRAGVSFLDGSTTLTLTQSDFVNGIYNLEFLFPLGFEGGYCHSLRIYDANNRLIGSL